MFIVADLVSLKEIQFHKWASTRENLSSVVYKLQRRRLIIAFVICYFENIISRLATSEFFIFWAPSTNVGELYCFRLVRSSVYQSVLVVTLTWSFLIEFLPNFIYGLLPSNSRSSSNTGFVRQAITKMADKMAAAYQFRLSWSL